MKKYHGIGKANSFYNYNLKNKILRGRLKVFLMEIKGKIELKNFKQGPNAKSKNNAGIKRLPPLPPKYFKINNLELKEHEMEKELTDLNENCMKDYRNITNMFIDQQRQWAKKK